MRYLLSNRQRKELANGKLIRVALPIPETPQMDLLDWARQHLDADPATIRRARQTNVWCCRTDAAQSRVEHQVGRILRDSQDCPPGQIVYSVDVVMVELSTRPTPRGEYPAQWPKDWTE